MPYWGWPANNTTSAAGTSYYTTATDNSTTYYYYPRISYVQYQWQTVYNPQPETDQQKRARSRREETQRLEQARQQKEHDEAVKQAEIILKEHIGQLRFAELERIGYIELDSHKPNLKYRIPKNHMDTIDVYEDGKLVDKLCIHPRIECPPGDHILSRVSLLENNEDYVLATANHNRQR